MNISDKKVDIDIELDKDLWYEIMMMAHHNDVTLNIMMQMILQDFVESFDIEES